MRRVSRGFAAALSVLATVAYFGQQLARFQTAPPYQAALTFVHTNAELARQVGNRLHVGYFPRGGWTPDDDRAAYTLRVTGARGRARVDVALARVDGRWRVIDASYAMLGGAARADRSDPANDANRAGDGRRAGPHAAADGVAAAERVATAERVAAADGAAPAGDPAGTLVDLDADRLARAQRLTNAGYALHMRERYAEALDEYDRALALDPDNTDALFYRGWARVALGRPHDGIADFTRLIEIRPDDPGAVYALGNAYGHAGDYERSLALLDRAVAADPDCGQCRYSRAITHARLGNAARNRADLEAACELGYGEACRLLEEAAR